MKKIVIVFFLLAISSISFGQNSKSEVKSVKRQVAADETLESLTAFADLNVPGYGKGSDGKVYTFKKNGYVCFIASNHPTTAAKSIWCGPILQ